MSPDQEESKFRVTADDLRSVDWESHLANCQEKECENFRIPLAKAAEDCLSRGDELGSRVFSFLRVIASFSPHTGSVSNPYGPMLTLADGRRSFVPDDLTDGDLDALKAILEEINDPEFRARVADVLWIRRRDFRAAQIAVDAFLESAERLKTDDLWPPYAERIERAAQLAAKKRGFQTECTKVVGIIEAAIGDFENNQKSGLLCARLMEILLDLGEGDVQRCSQLSERLAQAFADEDEWHFCQIYWQLAVRWHRRGKEPVSEQRCLIAAAEADISRAKQGLESDPPQVGYSAHWMGKGVEGLRRAKADPGRIKEVHREFLRLQKASLCELDAIDLDEDQIEGLKENREGTQKASAEHVSGREFVEAVGRFALIRNPTNLEALKERDAKTTEGMIWDKLVDSVALDKDGKVADTMPARGFGETDQEEATLRKRLVQSAREIEWRLSVTWCLEPARCAILGEHTVRPRDLTFLVENNPFIPPGHDGIYLRGIHAGFYADWLIAMHLLIPQLEASVRHVLQQHGVITSTIESDGTQKERDINVLLWLKETEVDFWPQHPLRPARVS